MSLNTLKNLRLITPGLLIIIFASLTGWISGLWGPLFSLNSDPRRLAYSLPVLLLGAAYYIFALRLEANKSYFDRVSENIRSKLIQISGITDNPTVYTWQRIRGIFYGLVDSDPSLAVKSRLAYFNGFFWTTAADVRALSAIFAIISNVIFAFTVVAFGSFRPLWSVAFFVLLWAATFPVSEALTRRHMGIADEQIEIIEHQHLAELRAKLGAIK